MNDWQAYSNQQDEEHLERRDRIRFILGMSDFFGLVLGFAFILILVLLIISLLSWLRQDILSTFVMLNSRF